MESFSQGQCSAQAAAYELGVSERRIRQLHHEYLRARARGHGLDWQPGCSGGAHHPAWSPEVETLVRKLLTARPPASYSFAASEVHRRLRIVLDRASVRRWALRKHIAQPSPRPAVSAGVRRWQRSQIGSLWQLDASPHAWFPDDPHLYPLLDMLDDCSRLIVGARLYERETLMAYFDFLDRAFREYGLPLALYVDYHSFFFSHDPEALTQLGKALKFYDISLLYAPTPQAKGKVERQHLFWQNRLPAFFSAEAIHQLDQANPPLDALRQHHNQQEIHREIRQTPQAAWDQAVKEGRSTLRPAPACPWWPYIWSLRKQVVVGSDGRVPVASQRLRVEVAPNTRIVQCRHPDGSISYLRHRPAPDRYPVVLLQWTPIRKV